MSDVKTPGQLAYEGRKGNALRDLSVFVGHYSHNVYSRCYDEANVRDTWATSRPEGLDIDYKSYEAEDRWVEVKDEDLDKLMTSLVRRAGVWPTGWLNNPVKLTTVEKRLAGLPEHCHGDVLVDLLNEYPTLTDSEHIHEKVTYIFYRVWDQIKDQANAIDDLRNLIVDDPEYIKLFSNGGKESEVTSNPHKRLVTDLMSKAMLLRHAHPQDLDVTYKTLEKALYEALAAGQTSSSKSKVDKAMFPPATIVRHLETGGEYVIVDIPSQSNLTKFNDGWKTFYSYRPVTFEKGGEPVTYQRSRIQMEDGRFIAIDTIPESSEFLSHPAQGEKA